MTNMSFYDLCLYFKLKKHIVPSIVIVPSLVIVPSVCLTEYTMGLDIKIISRKALFALVCAFYSYSAFNDIVPF
jgi:hypothetical protein